MILQFAGMQNWSLRPLAPDIQLDAWLPTIAWHDWVRVFSKMNDISSAVSFWTNNCGVDFNENKIIMDIYSNTNQSLTWKRKYVHF